VITGSMVTTALVIARQVAAFRHIEELLRERDLLAARLTEQAYHDSLTGLANRALFMNRLTELLATGPVTVFLIDLDDFKPVNDSLGHATGDQLLVEVASRLRRCVRAEDTVARLGGDEFAVLAADPTGLLDALTAALNDTVRLGDAEVRLRASVGQATSRPDADDADSVLHSADMAMYAVKNAARSYSR
jgi:diguanylate cyclase (GGDEF)-like protein